MRRETKPPLPMLVRVEPYLKTLGLSDREASIQAIGTPNLIREMRRGVMPSADKLAKLARVFGCRMEWLISGEGPETDAPPVLTADERELLEAYRALSANKSAALAVVQSLVMTERRGDGPPHSAGQSSAPKVG